MNVNYDEKIRRLYEEKLFHTQEKRDIIGYIDSDDSGMILPPEHLRKRVETISGSGMPIVDVVFNHVVPGGKKGPGYFYGPIEVGENFRQLLDAHPVYVNPDSPLSGAIMTSFLSYRTENWNPDFSFEHLKPLQEKYQLVHGIGGAQHLCQDLQIGLDLGWDGLRAKVEEYKAIHTDDPEKQDFYYGLLQVIDGMQSWILRTAEEARRMSENEHDQERRKNLLEIVRVNEKVAHQKPETFREACQWIMWYQMGGRVYNNSGSLGALDVFLLPYYRKDKEAGTLTDEQAIYILAAMLLYDTSYIQLGGYDSEGNDVTNPVSYLILEAVHKTKIPSNVGLCVGKGISRDLLRRGVELQFQDKCGNPRFVGSDHLIESFMRNGYDYPTAASRVNSGCHWTSIPGREYSQQDCIKINLAVVFSIALRELVSDGGEATMERLWEIFSHHLEIAVLEIAKSMDFHYRNQHLSMPELYLDLLCYGPVEKGLDCSNGGVEFYNFCLDGSALATVADSFAALQNVVVDKKRYTFQELVAILDADWAGDEGEKARQYCANSPRYGEGNSVGDDFAAKVSVLFADLVKAKPTPDGHNMIPGLFSWANTIPMGKTLVATPNGRFAGAPISHGANPHPGFREDGAATAMSHAIALVQSGWGNTAPMQIELEPSITQEEGGVEIVMALIEDHFNHGGTLINLNVLDAERVLKAHKDPMKYPDLVVRVTGFSAYFASLSPQFRQLVVDRLLSKEIA